MALADLTALVNATMSASTHEMIYFAKYWTTAAVSTGSTFFAGHWHSAWICDGYPAPAGTAPGAVANPTRSTTGALGQANAGSGTRYIYSLIASGNSPGTLLVYDRLLHISGLSGTSTSAQTVGGTLTRNTGGTNNFIMAEAYTALGTGTGVTISASYTNQAGTSGRTSAATSVQNGLVLPTRAVSLPLAAGDYGVRAVASVTLSGSTGTTADFGVTIGKPLAQVNVRMGRSGSYVGVAHGFMAPVDTDACLGFIWTPYYDFGSGNLYGVGVQGAIGFVEA